MSYIQPVEILGILSDAVQELLDALNNSEEGVVENLPEDIRTAIAALTLAFLAAEGGPEAALNAATKQWGEDALQDAINS